MPNAQLTIADLFGFEYIRTGMPEYLRIIERSTLTHLRPVCNTVIGLCSALLCTLMYTLWWYIGKWFATVRYLNKI